MDDAQTLHVLSSLSHRLQRLEYYLSGATPTSEVQPHPQPTDANQTIRARLARLEHDLASLASRSAPVRELLSLQSKHPNLFNPPSSSTTATTTPDQPDHSTKTSTLLSLAPQFPTTASRLATLRDTPIPPASSSAKLLALKPRLERLREAQERQDVEIQALRARSARVLEWWYVVGVVGRGECWVDWEGRVREVEKGVRRLEGRKEREEREERAEVGRTV